MYKKSMTKKHLKKKNRNKTKKKRTLQRKTKGGQAIGSGGFGCVFSPPLACKGKPRPEGNIVSKLMIDKDAFQEAKEMSIVYNIIKKIKDYNKYFIVEDVSNDLCKPNPLTDIDLKNYNKVCKSLVTYGANAENVNDFLEILRIINIPYGGIEVEKFFMDNLDDPGRKNIHKANRSLLLLLKNGIIPMNNKGLYHCDIKASNILIDTNQNYLTRLIDWGFACTYNNEKVDGSKLIIPRSLLNRVIQFNVPYSIILFSDNFVKILSENLILHDKDGTNKFIIDDDNKLVIFLSNYAKFLFSLKGRVGHLMYINNFICKLYNITSNEEGTIHKKTGSIILNYIKLILQHFFNNIPKSTKDSVLKTNLIDDKKSLVIQLLNNYTNLFMSNIDTWGFIMSYKLLIISQIGVYKKNVSDMIKFILANPLTEINYKLISKYLYVVQLDYIKDDNSNNSDNIKDLPLTQKKEENSKK
jgi:serine/threonine protein kinase